MGKQQKLKEIRRAERLMSETRSGPSQAAYVIAGLFIIGVGIVGWKVYKNTAAAEPSPSPQVSVEAIIASPQVSVEAVTATPTPMEPNSTPVATQTAVLKTTKGDITLELYRDVAPKTVDNFVKLSKEKFYDGTKFHRVISDFMIQGGDPLSKDSDPSNDGTGDPGYKFEDEINPRSLGLSDAQIKQYEGQGYVYDYTLQSLPVDPGYIAMANSGPNTNGSQFFIVTVSPQKHLYGKHTAFGKVTKGMDVVRQITQGDEVLSVRVK